MYINVYSIHQREMYDQKELCAKEKVCLEFATLSQIRRAVSNQVCTYQSFLQVAFVFTSIWPNDEVFEENLRWPFWFEMTQIRAWWHQLITSTHPSSMVTSGWLINKLILMLQSKKCVWRWKENRSCSQLHRGLWMYGDTWHSNKTVML